MHLRESNDAALLMFYSSNSICFFFLSSSLFAYLGDITQKGYEKKRSRLLAPYLPKPTSSSTASSSASSAATGTQKKKRERKIRDTDSMTNDNPTFRIRTVISGRERERGKEREICTGGKQKTVGKVFQSEKTIIL